MRTDDGRHTRSGKRVSLGVPIAVDWTEDGRFTRIEGKTIDVSPKGCFVIVSQGLVIGQKIHLINLVNGNQRQAEVVRQGQRTDAGWELGIQLSSPSDDFWALDF